MKTTLTSAYRSHLKVRLLFVKAAQFLQKPSKYVTIPATADGQQFSPGLIRLTFNPPAQGAKILGINWTAGMNIHIFAELDCPLTNNAMTLPYEESLERLQNGL